MFLKNNKFLYKSHFLRNVMLLGLIILTSLFLAGYILYTRISTYTLTQSRKEISEDLQEYNSMFKEDGLKAIVDDVTEEEEDNYFMNVAENGILIAENHPKKWNNYDLQALLR